MSAVESLGWLAPAPTWGQAAVGLESPALLQPWLVELTSDQFVAQFKAVMGAQGGAVPSDLATMAPAGTDGANYRLYQPLSQRYYLVTASLVCRRVGIPDRLVAPALGEKTTFVMRQLAADGSEQAMVAGAWTPVAAGVLAPEEQQFPMHAVPVAGFAPPGSTAATFGMAQSGGRTVFYGYVPVGLRAKLVPALSDAEAVAALAAVDPPTATNPIGAENPILGDLVARVIGPWTTLQSAPPAGTNTGYSSLYVLLDLGDWLRTYLPDAYQAIIDATPVTGAASGLVSALGSVMVDTVPGSGDPSTSIPLTQALADLALYDPLVTGKVIPGPPATFDLVSGSVPADWLASSQTPGSLAALAVQALQGPPAVPVTVPPELSGMITIDPQVPVAGQSVTTYVIRTVFEHDPCVPVLSQPSAPFELARALDPDAPARQIRIQLPDVGNLRQFKRGVALEMPPNLRRIMDRVTPNMLKGDGLNADPGVELGMICSFSLQIIFILAFMLMFIFLILFNIIFWWMAFIKICFPIPTPAPSEPQPQP